MSYTLPARTCTSVELHTCSMYICTCSCTHVQHAHVNMSPSGGGGGLGSGGSICGAYRNQHRASDPEVAHRGMALLGSGLEMWVWARDCGLWDMSNMARPCSTSCRGFAYAHVTYMPHILHVFIPISPQHVHTHMTCINTTSSYAISGRTGGVQR